MRERYDEKSASFMKKKSSNVIHDGSYEYIVPFKPLHWQIEPWRDKSGVLLLEGGAGGGKSRLAAEKMHAFCLKYPHSTGLILRKVRASMANSTLLFMKRKIIGKDPRILHRPSEFRFEYSNGSVLAYGGMKDADQREHIRSIGQDGGLDICWIEEAIQFQEEDFDEVIARIRGRAAGWTQVILSTNPGSPAHWIKRRLIDGEEATVYSSYAGDNPYNPDNYKDRLNTLSGVRRLRMLEGLWIKDADVVFDQWSDRYNANGDAGGNVTEDADWQAGGGEFALWVDDGYSGKRDKKTGFFTGRSHPRCFLFVQLRSDGRFAVFHEEYGVKRLASDHVAEIRAKINAMGLPEPSYVVYDRAAANLGGELRNFNFNARYNTLPVTESIKQVNQLLAADENGYRRIIVSPSCRILRAEMASFKRNSRTGKVIKEFDHGPDCIRMGIWDSVYGKKGTVDVAYYGEQPDRPKPQVSDGGDHFKLSGGISVAVYGGNDDG